MLTQTRWRPAPIFVPRPRVLAQAIPPEVRALGLGISAVGILISATIGAGTAWVGYDVATHRKGWLKAAGYVVGITGAFSVLFDLAALAGVGYLAAQGASSSSPGALARPTVTPQTAQTQASPLG